MRIKKNVKRILSFGMATVMAVSLLVTGGGSLQVEAAAPPVQDAANAVNYATILGRATDYGIVAEKFDQVNHMETTFAFVDFSNGGYANEVDFLPDTATAQFLLGGISSGQVFLGNSQSAKIYNIEATSEAIGGFSYPYIDSDGNPHYKYEEGRPEFRDLKWKIDHEFKDTQTLVVTERADAITNIRKIISNADEKSEDMETKAKSNDYKLDSSYIHTNSGNNGIVIDVSGEEFENKVVYVDVDDTIKQYFLSAGDGNANSDDVNQGVGVIKNKSTVVVFNFSENNTAQDSLKISKIVVKVKDLEGKVVDASGNPVEDGADLKDVWIQTDSATSGGIEKNGVPTTVLDQQVCQKIIYNVRTDGDVELNTVAGTTLIPGTNNVKVTGSSAGWLVSGGEVTNPGAEWHYTYRGGNQEYMTDGVGQIHFAARKSFTHKYNGTKTLEDTTVECASNLYGFDWYQVDDTNYDITGKTPVTVTNQATNTIKFPSISFYSDETKAGTDVEHYIPAGDHKDYYYVIKEKAKDSTYSGIDEIDNSSGYINIHLRVTNTNGRLDYYVDSNTYLGDDSLYKTNTNVHMSGVEFTLGAFFNLINKENSAELDVLKTDKNGTALKDAKFVLTGVNGTKNITFNKGQLANGTAGKVKSDGTSLVFYSGQTKSTIVNLTKGTYTLKELTSPYGYKTISDDITFTVDDSGNIGYTGTITGVDFTAKSGNNNDMFSIKNSDESVDYTTIELSKVIAGGLQELSGAKLKLTGNYDNGETINFSETQFSAGTSAQYVSDGESLIFVSGSAPSTVTSLPDGHYSLEETLAPDGYGIATTISFDIVDGVVKQNGTEVTRKDDATGNKIITMEDALTSNEIEIKKIDASTKDEVPGAKLTLTGTYPSGNAISFSQSQFDGGSGAQYISAGSSLVFISGTESSVIRNLPDGDYTLSETTAPDGYGVATDITFSISNGQVTGKNVSSSTKQDVEGLVTMEDSLSSANITFKKVAADNTSMLIGPASITLTGKYPSNNTIDFSSLTGVTANGVNNWTVTATNATFETIAYQETHINGLPDGTYTITETNAPDGYTEAAPISFTILNGVASGANVTSGNTVTLVDDQDNTAEIIVNKVDGSNVVLSGAKLKLTKDPADYTFTSSNITLGTDASLVDAETGATGLTFITGSAVSTIKNLPNGSYTLSEVDAPSGYDKAQNVSFSVDNGVITCSDSRYVSADNKVTLTDNESNTGDLVLKKTVSGSVSNNVFTFYVYGQTTQKWYDASGIEHDDQADAPISVDCTNAQGVKISNLPVQIYTVSEADATNNAADNWDYKVAQSVTSKDDVSVTKGNSVTATLENKYVKKTGSINIDKAYGTGSEQAAHHTNDTYYVTLKDADDNYYDEHGAVSSTAVPIAITPSSEGTTTVPNLDLDKTYTVTEITGSADATHTADTAGYNLVSVVEPTSVSFTNTLSQDVTVTNTYSEIPAPTTGTLTVTKSIAPNTAQSTDEVSFTVRVGSETGANAKYLKADGSVGTSAHEFTVVPGVNGTPITLKSDALDKMLTVEEVAGSEATISGYTFDSVSYTNNGATVASGGSETIGITNTYTEQTTQPGDLVITKNVDVTGTAPTGLADEEFTVTITLTDTSINGQKGDANFTNGVAELVIKNGVPKTVSGIPVGTGYTITENALSQTQIDAGYAKGTITNGTGTITTSDVNVTVGNTYTEQTTQPGDLVITKNVDVTGTAPTGLADEEFTVTITLTDTSINGQKGDANFTNGVAELVIKNGVPKTVSGIPVGTGYTITENALSQTQIDAGYAKGTITNGTGTIATSDVNVTVGNTYTEQTTQPGDLVITKNVDVTGTAPTGLADEEFTVTITLTDTSINGQKGDANFTNGVAELVIKNGVPKTVSGIPVGTGYTITENALSQTQIDAGYAKGTITNGTGTIATSDVNVTVGNTYTEQTTQPGDLVITKNVDVTGTAPTGLADEEFTVTITLTDTSINGQKGDANFTNGVAELVIKNGVPKTVSGIPVGTGYTITENALSQTQIDAGYAKGTITNGTGTIATSDVNVTVGNTYTEQTTQPGDLVITKNVDVTGTAPTGLADEEFTVTITLTDTSINGQKGDANFTNGVAELVIKNGVPKTVSGIPVGTGYTITENALSQTQIDAGYAKGTITNGTGTIATSDVNVTVGNTYTEQTTQPGDLVITKNVDVTGTAPTGLADEEFTVTMTLTDTSINGTKGDANFTNGVAELVIKNGVPKTVSGIPVGTGYTITENALSQTQIDAGYAKGTITNGTGTIATSDVNVTVGNTYTEQTPQPTTGKLTLTKTFGGDVTKDEIAGDTITFEIKCGTKWLNTSTKQLQDRPYEILLSTLTPDSTGLKYSMTIEDIPSGNYDVIETNKSIYIKENGQKTGIPFTLSKTSKTTDSTSVSATAAGTLELTDNYTKPAVKISKIDATGKQEIEGAELVLYSSDDKGNKTGSTEIKWKSKKTVETFYLEAGTYTIQETVAPSGYEKTTNLFIFKVEYDSTDNDKLVITQLSGDHMPGTYDKTTGLISFENDPIKATGGLKITVLEEGTKRVVPNATVEVEAPEGTTFPDGSTKITVVTDSNGQVTKYTGKDGKEYKLTEGLTPGDYKITVTKVPDGYKVTVGKTETVTVKTGEVAEHVALIATSETSKDETPSKEETKPGTPNKDTTKVDTGDHMNVIPIIVIMVISLIASIVVIIRKRKMRYEY